MTATLNFSSASFPTGLFTYGVYPSAYTSPQLTVWDYHYPLTVKVYQRRNSAIFCSSLKTVVIHQ